MLEREKGVSFLFSAKGARRILYIKENTLKIKIAKGC
jgi:hypothetical protein